MEPPTYQLLARICVAHLNTFPFENISKLLYFKDGKDLPSLSTFVENHQDAHYGGTCYTLNVNLFALLEALGFDCHLIMLGEEHVGIIVTIDQVKYYVDCGAAAPFFRPVNLNNTSHNAAVFGGDCVHILPVNMHEQQFKYERFVNGEQNGKTWFFQANKRCEVADFRAVMTASNQAGTTFMTILRCQKWQTDQERSVSLVNNTFGIRYADGKTVRHTLKSVKEIEKVIAEEFLLPKLPVAEAVSVLNGLGVDIFATKS
ncbi:arylamine N-acetyltransferase [Shouchella lonarensis]|uniref:Arylamine N-acetyltransferase n=1 Tax=Shouchella lonarensis TaxID=1464122 RepID=A0A1G6NHI4_9BACI|nr:arylamine N-acetyltransferase [Shouchella lonarensis]SDC66727.1 Arylamine N-acetyltransferase [Shouchella lonarensis]